ncbi:MAG TPA: HDOD domain-containing protein [Bryobacteraceae bacterium]|nr:HDOD domain-containing protein [Bryobacteraceae bacterium]
MPNLATETVSQTPAPAPPWALDQLPPFPLVATRLVAMLAREDVDTIEVGRLIAAEPVFATRVLQMANSPLFALERQVKTISHAIVLLGLDRVKAITVTRALEDYVAPALSTQALRACWQNSLAIAFLSERLARSAKMDGDFAYVAGLLADLGRLALLVKYPGPYANLLAVSAEEEFDLIMMERELFDIDHCEAGGWLTRKMLFPLELTEVVTNHHAPLDHREFRMLHLVQAADRLAEALGFGILPPVQPPSVKRALEQVPEVCRLRLETEAEQWKQEIATRVQARY